MGKLTRTLRGVVKWCGSKALGHEAIKNVSAPRSKFYIESLEARFLLSADAVIPIAGEALSNSANTFAPPP